MSGVDMTADFDAARVYKGILSGDTDLVDSLFRSIEPVKMYEVCAKVIHELSMGINTPMLDVFMKKTLYDKRGTVLKICTEISQFIERRKKVDSMEEGYPKHQATMVLYGKDPLTYHEWCDVQENLRQAGR